MAVGASGDVPLTLHHPAGVMGNPGDQAGPMVQEFEAYVQDELILVVWIILMWILISMVISYGFYTMIQLAFPNEETYSTHVFEELENSRSFPMTIGI